MGLAGHPQLVDHTAANGHAILHARRIVQRLVSRYAEGGRDEDQDFQISPRARPTLVVSTGALTVAMAPSLASSVTVAFPVAFPMTALVAALVALSAVIVVTVILPLVLAVVVSWAL